MANAINGGKLNGMTNFDNVRSKRSPSYLLAILLVLPAFFGSAQQVIKGQADFSHHDFVTTGSSDLSGIWEFYYNQLLTPKDFEQPQKPEWIAVPGSWHLQGNYDRMGYATYRVRLHLSGEQSGLTLYIPVINSAAKIWMNGDIVAEAGSVSPDRNSYKPKLLGSVISIPGKVSDIELIVQAVNYTNYNAGIGSTPQLGRSSTIFWDLNKSNGIENFFAGSLASMFVYQLILYFLYHRGKPHLWLALICLGVALRALIVHGGSFLLPNLFPSVPWEIWKKIEFGSVYSSVAFFPLYVYYLFIESAPRKPITFFVGIASLLFLTVLVTPQYIYGNLLEVAHVSLLLAFFYAFYSITKAWRAGNKDAKIILFGVAASFPFILIEILKNSVLFPVNFEFMYMVEMGVLVFLLFQVYLLANHQAKSYKSLESMNQNLEMVVTERTSELVKANSVKDKLLSVMSHDIKSPLAFLEGTLHLYNKGSINREEFNQFTHQIESDLSKTNLLVENILHWTASQLHGVKIKVSKFDVLEVIKQNLLLFETIAAKKRLTFKYNIEHHFEINGDRNIMNLVLRNLLANAIKFSHEGGEIDIQLSSGPKSLVLEVKDHGVGMNSATLQAILSIEGPLSTVGTDQEKGTGLGLAICRDYLMKTGGSLTVESLEGKGSTFVVEFPLA